MQSLESIYQQTIRPLPVDDQLRLAEIIRQRAGDEPPSRRSALEILRNIQPPKPIHSVAEIDSYIREERDSWDD